MDKAAYLEELNKIVGNYTSRTYDDWKHRIIADLGIERLEYVSDDGSELQVVIDAFWDAKPDGLIRIFFSIDDGGWRAWSPVALDELVGPNNVYL